MNAEHRNVRPRCDRAAEEPARIRESPSRLQVAIPDGKRWVLARQVSVPVFALRVLPATRALGGATDGRLIFGAHIRTGAVSLTKTTAN